MKKTQKHQQAWLLILVGGIIPLTLLLGNEFDIPQKFVILIVLVTAFIFGAMTIWIHANSNASGDEWWQDDRSSGWRGY